MKNKFNYTKKNYLGPWIRVSIFELILNQKKNISQNKIKLAKKFNRDGYIIIDLNLSDKFIQKIKKDIDKKLNEGNVKKNPSIYHYIESRIVEAWKFSSNVAKLALNQKIKNTLKLLYEKVHLHFNIKLY